VGVVVTFNMMGWGDLRGSVLWVVARGAGGGEDAVWGAVWGRE